MKLIDIFNSLLVDSRINFVMRSYNQRLLTRCCFSFYCDKLTNSYERTYSTSSQHQALAGRSAQKSLVSDNPDPRYISWGL
jgi:hypothetical protein